MLSSILSIEESVERVKLFDGFVRIVDLFNRIHRITRPFLLKFRPKLP